MKLSRDKNFYKTLLTLTLTIALQNVVVNGVGLADNIMLGGYSEDALSACPSPTRSSSFCRWWSWAWVRA